MSNGTSSFIQNLIQNFVIEGQCYSQWLFVIVGLWVDRSADSSVGCVYGSRQEPTTEAAAETEIRRETLNKLENVENASFKTDWSRGETIW